MTSPSTPYIREIKPEDFEELVSMISEMAHMLMLDKSLLIEKSPPEERAIRLERLRQALYESPAQIEARIAIASGQIAGFYTFYQVFSTYRGQAGLFLEDLYVKDAFRQQGLGNLLMRHLIELGKSRGCHGLSWQVPHDRPFLHRFYKGLGAIKDDHWTMYLNLTPSI